MRKDLNMRKGKMIAQGAHAALEVFLSRARRSGDLLSIDMTPAMAFWVGGAVAKVCVGVTSEAQLLDVFDRARLAGLSCALITDSGKTEFGGVPTRTCCAIGPDWADQVDAITGDLPLL